ncbi:hypothetical protein ACWEOW_02360 [Monashia sp. NPDC004114]
MPTAPLAAPATGDTSDTTETSAATVDEQFLDLICNDPDLVAAEFEAIIAAEWPEPPTRLPGRGAAGGPSGGGGVRRAVDTGPDHRWPAPDPQIRRWARQRSPPLPPNGADTDRPHETEQ